MQAFITEELVWALHRERVEDAWRVWLASRVREDHGDDKAWVPLWVFSILFGLSMDYHVFLLSRIRERWLHSGDNRESVAFGLRTTAGIIIGAALIMIGVFGGIAAGELVPLQQMGFGLAVAVLMDATVVRSVIVPAAMELLGDRNWYLPKWLEWIPDLREREGREAAEAGGPARWREAGSEAL